MKGMQPVCCVCGAAVSGTLWLCALCRAAHPELRRPYAEWPAWAKALANQEHGERRWQERWAKRQVLVSTQPEEYDEWVFLEHMMGGSIWRKPKITRWPWWWLPPYPYVDGAMNAAYRQVHHITWTE